jgi:hypothetical protein
MIFKDGKPDDLIHFPNLLVTLIKFHFLDGNGLFVTFDIALLQHSNTQWPVTKVLKRESRENIT